MTAVRPSCVLCDRNNHNHAWTGSRAAALLATENAAAAADAKSDQSEQSLGWSAKDSDGRNGRDSRAARGTAGFPGLGTGHSKERRQEQHARTGVQMFLAHAALCRHQQDRAFVRASMAACLGDLILVLGAQMLIAGKVGQAAVLAAAAYKNEAAYRKVTGIKKTRLVIDKNARNTHVRPKTLLCAQQRLRSRHPAQACIHQ